ncbi:MAG: CYTH domain-containing protein [Idiomarina sp.]|nr:CYTH domain-containing protein [Idiomarina sp.]
MQNESSAPELELKFLLTEAQEGKVMAWLNEHAQAVGQKQLDNRYFDTPKGDIKAHKMGLRIRRWADGAEQTIKLAGTRDGAFSARPEYNVSTHADIPDLTLFPDDIWPQGFVAGEVSSVLQEQFRVHFTRTLWEWSIGSSSIEVALDRGEIVAQGKRAPIFELELELLGGAMSDLVTAAESLNAVFNLAPGEKSKAQRGFELLAKQSMANK